MVERKYRTVTESEKGWIVSINSIWSGDMTGRKVLVPFSISYPAGTDVNGDHNEYGTIESYLVWLAVGNAKGCKVLKKGHKVQ